ncbi:poly(ethylene terephthalate) hydrolase family protein [Streptomyces avermitilis]
MHEHDGRPGECLLGAAERRPPRDHLAPASESPTVGRYALSWLKRFVDNDTRYDQFLCPGPTPDTNVSQYRNTCPNS